MHGNFNMSCMWRNTSKRSPRRSLKGFHNEKSQINTDIPFGKATTIENSGEVDEIGTAQRFAAVNLVRLVTTFNQ